MEHEPPDDGRDAVQADTAGDANVVGNIEEKESLERLTMPPPPPVHGPNVNLPWKEGARASLLATTVNMWTSELSEDPRKGLMTEDMLPSITEAAIRGPPKDLKVEELLLPNPGLQQAQYATALFMWVDALPREEYTAAQSAQKAITKDGLTKILLDSWLNKNCVKLYAWCLGMPVNSTKAVLVERMVTMGVRPIEVRTLRSFLTRVREVQAQRCDPGPMPQEGRSLEDDGRLPPARETQTTLGLPLESESVEQDDAEDNDNDLEDPERVDEDEGESEGSADHSYAEESKDLAKTQELTEQLQAQLQRHKEQARHLELQEREAKRVALWKKAEVARAELKKVEDELARVCSVTRASKSTRGGQATDPRKPKRQKRSSSSPPSTRNPGVPPGAAAGASQDKGRKGTATRVPDPVGSTLNPSVGAGGTPDPSASVPGVQFSGEQFAQVIKMMGAASRRRLSWRWRGVLCSRSNLTTPNRWACCYGACDKHTSFSAREVKGFIQKLNYNFFRFFGKIMRPSGFKKKN